MTTWAVLTRIGKDTWENVWGETDANGERTPLTFKSRKEAREELQELLDSSELQDLGLKRRDYKIVRLH